MKKVIAAVLILAVAICFAACKKKDDPASTLPNLSTAAPAVPSSTDVTLPSADTSTTNADSLILTTKTGETVPSIATTAVSLDPNAVTALTTSLVVIPTTNPVVPPPVVTSQQPYVSTTPTSIPGSSTPTSDGTSSQTPSSSNTLPTVEPTTSAPGPSGSTPLTINDVSATGEKKVVLSVDTSGWNGSFKRNSQSVSVTVDGRKYTVPASISEGSTSISVDLTNVEVEGGTQVSVSIPSAFLQTSDGTQYNKATSVSGSVYF